MGTGSFENDDALEWLGSLAASQDALALEAALDDVANSEQPKGVAACNVALAAAEIIAAVFGRPAYGLPEDAARLAQCFSDSSRLVLAKARVAVARVRRNSELCDLRRETNDFPKWQASVADLERRLFDRG